MVGSGRSSRSVPVPPTSFGKRPSPSPKVPWQAAHWSAKTSDPRCTEPFPSGRPKPSSPRTSISQPPISAGVATLPYPKCPGSAADPTGVLKAMRAAESTMQCSSELNIEHAPIRLDLPGLGRIVVIDRIGAALLAQLRDGRLHIACLIHRARFEERRPAIPAPSNSELGQRLRQHRLVQDRALPVDAAVNGHIDPLHFAA